jgi:ABC-2 type transport system ATP-binding protein
MSNNVLEVTNLVKDYAGFRAVDGVSFVVPKGSVVGFLGPNGAGKTTTIQILLGITEASSGKISYFGKNFHLNREECLSRINFTSAFNTLLGRISVLENLIVYAELYGVKNPRKKIDELVAYFEMGDLLNNIYWHLSAGQKTRVNLVKSLLNDPDLVLMDEPTASLDPDIADKVLTLIEKLRKERNLSILYTSHNMDEITRICDDVIFLDHGKKVAQDTPENLTKRITSAEIKLHLHSHVQEIQAYLKSRELVFSYDNHILKIDTQNSEVPEVLFAIGKMDPDISDIEILKPTLEDVFLQIARGDKNES